MSILLHYDGVGVAESVVDAASSEAAEPLLFERVL